MSIADVAIFNVLDVHIPLFGLERLIPFANLVSWPRTVVA